MKRAPKTDDRGFTLLEVLVAVALLATSFLVVSQLFSGSLRLAGLNKHYAQAVSFADRKMDEILQSKEEVDEEGYTDSGDFNGLFKWEVSVTPYEGLEVEDDLEFPLSLYDVQVKVTWGEGERQRLVWLNSVKTFNKSNKG